MSSDAGIYLIAIHFVQVALVAALIAPLAQFTSKKNAQLSHALWALVLLKCCTPPLLASPTGVFSWFHSTAYDHASTQWSIAFDTAHAGSSAAEERLHSAAPQSARSPSWDNTTPDAQRSATAFIASYNLMRQNPVLTTWLMVSGLFAVGMLIRLGQFLAQIRRFIQTQSPEAAEINRRVQEIANSVASQLLEGVKVRVYVLDQPVGPAIVGLFRPTVLMPKVVVETCSTAELEALIGHELMHFRRGDLWWSLVQALALCLAWGNPVVWIASRRMSEEAEKCCDEQTIAKLNICPTTYAHCLIAVLERKQTLRAAPLLPGVRPVEITSKRLERIMRFRHGSQVRSSRWVLATLLLGASIILPGATFSLAQEESQERPDKPALLYEIRILQLPSQREAELFAKWHGQASQDPAVRSNDTQSVSVQDGASDAQVIPASFTPAPVQSKYRSLNQKQIDELISTAETLSVPKVLAICGTKASLSMGKDIPFVTGFEVIKDENGNPTKTLQPKVSFVQEGIRLDLVGHLTKDADEVMVKVDFKTTELIDSDTFTFEIADQEATIDQPNVRSLEVQTTVQVPLEETIILPCGTQEHFITSEQPIPVISSIPYVGRLFKNKGIGINRMSTVMLIRCEVKTDITLPPGPSQEGVTSDSGDQAPQEFRKTGERLPSLKQPK